jgi:sphinganine C4-monooxygenase
MFPSHNVNVTAAQQQQQHALFDAHPIYYSPAPSLLPALSDPLLTVLAPLPAYWLTSALFQLLDLSSAPWLRRHRIHDSAEVAARNRASRGDVFRAVVLPQILQTALALAWVSEPLARPDHPEAMRGIARALLALLSSPVLGLGLGAFDGAADAAADAAAATAVVAPLAYVLYWWAIPAARLLLAMYVSSPHRLSFSPPTQLTEIICIS